MLRTVFSRRLPYPSARVYPALIRPRYGNPPLALISRPGLAAFSEKQPGPSKHEDNVGTKAQDEARTVASDLAKTIAGNTNAHAGNLPNQPVRSAQGMDAVKEDFASITSTIAAQVPQPLMAMGLAGGLPYIGTSLFTVWSARQAALAAEGLSSIDPATALAALTQCTEYQIAYGAVMLSFLGAIHWGLEIAAYGGQHGYRRLILGVVPVLYSVPTLMLAPQLALAVQWAGFTGMWYADMKATGAGWAPSWYSQYRFYLSVLVGSCIILTLGGTNYFGPSSVAAPATFSSLTKHRELERAGKGPEKTIHLSKAPEITSVKGDEMSDSFVFLKKTKDEKEEKEKDKQEGGQEGEGGEEGGKDEGKDKGKDEEKKEEWKDDKGSK